MDYKSAKKYLRPDKIWEGWDVYSHKEFIEKMIPEIHFKKNVHEDIIKEFEILKCLLVHAYYRYQFFDIAVNKSLQIMEMAFKIKYRELHQMPAVNVKVPLWKLIRELERTNHFEDQPSYVHRLRELRNSFLHPDRHSFAGSVFSNVIKGVVQVINELYEDIPLRIERRALKEDFRKSLKESLSENTELLIYGQKLPVHLIQTVLIDNKEPEPISHLFVVPLYPLAPYKNRREGKGIRVPQVIPVAMERPVFTDGILRAFDKNSNSEVMIQNIEEEKTLIGVKKWKADYEILKAPHFLDHSWGFNAGIMYSSLMEEFTIKEESINRILIS